MERAVGIGQCGGYQISLGGIDHNLFGRGAKVVKMARSKEQGVRLNPYEVPFRGFRGKANNE